MCFWPPGLVWAEGGIKSKCYGGDFVARTAFPLRIGEGDSGEISQHLQEVRWEEPRSWVVTPGGACGGTPGHKIELLLTPE